MARGRLVSRTLGSSRKFAALSQTAGKLAEFAQSLYPLLVANSDDYGRMAGDAFTVKHAVFPTSRRKESEFRLALNAMHNSGLIRLYEAEGQLTLQIEQFDEHQPGLSKRTKSKFPGPPVNFTEIPESPGNSKATELNRTEFKGTEGNRKDPNLPTPKARRPVRSVENLTPEDGTDARTDVEADMRDSQRQAVVRPFDGRPRMAGAHQGGAHRVAAELSDAGAGESGDGCGDAGVGETARHTAATGPGSTRATSGGASAAPAVDDRRGASGARRDTGAGFVRIGAIGR